MGDCLVDIVIKRIRPFQKSNQDLLSSFWILSKQEKFLNQDMSVIPSPVLHQEMPLGLAVRDADIAHGKFKSFF